MPSTYHKLNHAKFNWVLIQQTQQLQLVSMVQYSTQILDTVNALLIGHTQTGSNVYLVILLTTGMQKTLDATLVPLDLSMFQH
jgi:hypothetical protein